MLRPLPRSHGKPRFRNFPFRRAEPVFYNFDVLWDDPLGTMKRRCADSEMTRTLVICHSSTAKFGFAGCCRSEVNAFSTATTSMMMVKDCSGSPAKTTWKALLRSAGVTLPARTRQLAQDSQPELLAMGRARRTVRA